MSGTMTMGNGWNGRTARWVTTGGGIALAVLAFASLRGGAFTRDVRAGFDVPSIAPDAMADGVIEIPREAASLQLAIDAAAPGMTIRLGEGTFVGAVTLTGKSLRIEGAGMDRTTLCGLGTSPVLTLRGGETSDSVVTGLALTGARGFGILADRTAATFGDLRIALNASGGACVRGGSPSFHACRFEDNHGTDSGGGLRNEGGSPVLVSCSFSRNVATTFGGAIFSDGGSVSVIDCDLSENGTNSGAWGGGIFGQGAQLDVHRTRFTRNTAVEAGGAVYLLGGRGTLSDCTFTANLAAEAGGVFGRGAGVLLTGSTLTGDREHAIGGGVNVDAGNVFGAGREKDCNQNGILDTEELALGWAKDIDGNGKPDACDMDCNSNGLPDAYEIASGWMADEDKDGMIDVCAIRLGLAEDANHDWVPDSVQQAGVPAAAGAAATDGAGSRETVASAPVRRARNESGGSNRPSDLGISMEGMRMRMASSAGR